MTTEMTAERAAYFMRRFKREEKLLGPNEQAAIDFVLAMLATAPATPAQVLDAEQILREFAASSAASPVVVQDERVYDRNEGEFVSVTEFAARYGTDTAPASEPAHQVAHLTPEMQRAVEDVQADIASEPVTAKCGHHFVRDDDALRHECCQKCGAVRSDPVTSEGEVVVTRAGDRIVAVTRQDDEGRILSTIAEAAFPAQAGSIDTLEFGKALAELIEAAIGTTPSAHYPTARQAFVAHIEAWDAARVAASRQDGFNKALSTPVKQLIEAAGAPTAQAGSELAKNGYVLMPIDLDDELWTAGCQAFRSAINQMTGRDGYVVKKTYAGMVKAALAKKGEQQ